MLIDPESIASSKNQKDTDLSTLLEDERLHGTRERDAMAKRSDWHYFQESSNFLLVEDATGENRPLMYKVYDKPTPVQTPAWPVLYSTFLKPSRDVLNRSPTVRPDQLRERAITLWIKREAYGDEKPPPLKSSSTLFDHAILNKKPVTRSVSLNSVAVSDTPRYHREDSITPYAAASGNSVVLTSNIASTTSQRHNHSADFSAHGIPDYGKDKRIVQMNKRVQLLKGKASAQLAEKKQLEARKVLAEQNMTYGEELTQGADAVDGESSFIEEGPSSRRRRQDSFSVGGSISTSFPRAASSLDVFGDGNSHRSMDELVREKVMKILEESRRPYELSMSQIRAMKLASKNKGHIERFDVEGPPKAGYCENCRTKYDSFEEVSRAFILILCMVVLFAFYNRSIAKVVDIENLPRPSKTLHRLTSFCMQYVDRHSAPNTSTTRPCLLHSAPTRPFVLKKGSWRRCPRKIGSRSKHTITGRRICGTGKPSKAFTARERPVRSWEIIQKKSRHVTTHYADVLLEQVHRRICSNLYLYHISNLGLDFPLSRISRSTSSVYDNYALLHRSSHTLRMDATIFRCEYIQSCSLPHLVGGFFSHGNVNGYKPCVFPNSGLTLCFGHHSRRPAISGDEV